MSDQIKINKKLIETHIGECLRSIVGNYQGVGKFCQLEGQYTENCEMNCVNKLDLILNTTNDSITDSVNDSISDSASDLNSNQNKQNLIAQIELEKLADAIMIDAIYFKFNNNDDIQNFINCIKTQNIYITIKTEQTILLHLNLNILIEFDKPFIDMSDNSIIIDMQSNYLLNRIYLLALKNEKVSVSVEFPTLLPDLLPNSIKNPSKITLYVKHLLYDTAMRKLIGKDFGFGQYFQQLNGGLINLEKTEPFDIITHNITNNTTYKFKLLTDNYVKGFFIKSDKINNLKHFSLAFYGNNMIDYDKYCIYKYCTKISDDLLYIPINPIIKEAFADISNCVTIIDQFANQQFREKNKEQLWEQFKQNPNHIPNIYCNHKIKPYIGAIDLERMDLKHIMITFESASYNKDDNLSKSNQNQNQNQNQIQYLGIYTLALNKITYDVTKGKLRLVKENNFNIVCQQTKETVYESIKPLLSEEEISIINKSIGFWRYIWNDTDIGLYENKLWTEIPVENSATEDQTKYIKQLIELQESDEVYINTYLGYHRCRLCEKHVGDKEYTFRVDFCSELIWPESYVHYLKDHNVKIDDRMTKYILK